MGSVWHCIICIWRYVQATTTRRSTFFVAIFGLCIQNHRWKNEISIDAPMPAFLFDLDEAERTKRSRECCVTVNTNCAHWTKVNFHTYTRLTIISRYAIQVSEFCVKIRFYFGWIEWESRDTFVWINSFKFTRWLIEQINVCLAGWLDKLNFNDLRKSCKGASISGNSLNSHESKFFLLILVINRWQENEQSEEDEKKTFSLTVIDTSFEFQRNLS